MATLSPPPPPPGIQVFGFLCTLFIGIPSFLVYPTKLAILVFLVHYPMTMFVSINLGWTPVIGSVVCYFIVRDYIFVKFFDWFPEVYSTWLTDAIFWLGFV